MRIRLLAYSDNQRLAAFMAYELSGTVCATLPDAGSRTPPEFSDWLLSVFDSRTAGYAICTISGQGGSPRGGSLSRSVLSSYWSPLAYAHQNRIVKPARPIEITPRVMTSGRLLIGMDRRHETTVPAMTKGNRTGPANTAEKAAGSESVRLPRQRKVRFHTRSSSKSGVVPTLMAISNAMIFFIFLTERYMSLRRDRRTHACNQRSQ